MPPKRKKYKKYISSKICEVKNCKKHIVCTWSIPQEDNEPFVAGVCKGHLRQHGDDDDMFNLYDHFDVTPTNVVGGVDRFGIKIARDQDLCMMIVNRKIKKNKSDSIERLNNWKEKNEGKKKPKKYKNVPKPRQTLSTVKTKDVNDDDINDVLADILG